MLKIKSALPVLLSIVLFACSHEEDSGVKEVEMPVYISIPGGDIQTRAGGDPGTYEKFVLPKYLTLYVVSTDASGVETVTAIVNRPLTAGWKGRARGAAEDSVYDYKGSVTVSLRPDRQLGEVYAAVSSEPLEGLSANPADKAAVLDRKIQVPAKDGSHGYVCNIYSTPYNYQDGGKYYGTVTDFQSDNPTIDLMLYHVAAKLDIIWNVASEVQSATRLRRITVKGLKQNDCYLFKPMAATTAGADTYAESFELNEGSQWYGRQSMYVMPYVVNGKYPVTIELQKDGSTTWNTVSPDITVNSGAVFTPWMVGRLQITNDLNN